MFDNIYKDKTILVTGDTGFKGSWLAIWLKELGANVIGYSHQPNTEKDNYVICGLEDRIVHINGDVRDYDHLKSIFDTHNPEIVFHMAAQALVLESYRDPLKTYDTNIMGTINILEAIRHTESVTNAVIITTDKCYDNKEWIYGYREVDRLGGKDPYSSSKAACEIVINSYIESFFNKDDSANIASARAGNVIGGGDWAKDRIVPDCIRSLIQKIPIIVRNPLAVRPWQHVLEPLSGYLKLGSLLYKQGKKFSGPWNFGPSTKSMVTVEGLVKEVINQWGEGEINILSDHSEEPEAHLLHLDISKALNTLKWKPKLTFQESIKYTIDEFKIEKYSFDQIYNQRIEHINNYCKI